MYLLENIKLTPYMMCDKRLRRAMARNGSACVRSRQRRIARITAIIKQQEFKIQKMHELFMQDLITNIEIYVNKKY